MSLVALRDRSRVGASRRRAVGMTLSLVGCAVLLSACERQITPPKTDGSDKVQATTSTAQEHAATAVAADATAARQLQVKA